MHLYNYSNIRICIANIVLFCIKTSYSNHLLVSGAIIEGPETVIYFPGQGPVEFSCNVSDGVTAWRVNGTTYLLSQLDSGSLPGHSRVLTNIVVNTPVNNTEYICISLISNLVISSNPAFLYIAGKCSSYIATCIIAICMYRFI